MPLSLIYLLYTFILILLAWIIIPKDGIKRLFIYALFFGAIGDMFWIVLYKLLNVGGYINYGPFGFLGLPFLPQIAWTCFILIYFYLLPKQKISRLIYTIFAALYCLFFSNVLLNLGIFYWNYGRVILPYFTYLIWLSLGTYGYLKIKLE